MHLDGAFAHAQLVSDYLVLLALLQPLQDLDLTRRKLDWLSPLVHRLGGRCPLKLGRGGQDAYWNISSPLVDEADRCRHLPERQASREIAPGSKLSRQKHLRRIIEFRHDNEGRARRRLCDHRYFLGNIGVAEALAMSIE